MVIRRINWFLFTLSLIIILSLYCGYGNMIKLSINKFDDSSVTTRPQNIIFVVRPTYNNSYFRGRCEA